MESCSSCLVQSKTNTHHTMVHTGRQYICMAVISVIIILVCVHCTFGSGLIDCAVHAQVAEVTIALEHKDQRGPSKQDASETQTLHQT